MSTSVVVAAAAVASQVADVVARASQVADVVAMLVHTTTNPIVGDEIL
jgi:hypothetical protein